MPQSAKLTETLHIRVTPALKQAVEHRARQMHLRPADIMRSAIAEAVVTQPQAETIEDQSARA